MRFLADMGVAMRIVEWLRTQGHDTKHLHEEGLQRMTDNDIFRKAAAENRVLLTFDLDFGEILALSRERTVSVVLFRLHNTRTPYVVERLKVTLKETKQMLESGAVVVVEDGRLRARRLPLRQ
jgi:predicted nuclease of predicted toxin-antitoxin system